MAAVEYALLLASACRQDRKKFQTANSESSSTGKVNGTVRMFSEVTGNGISNMATAKVEINLYQLMDQMKNVNGK